MENEYETVLRTPDLGPGAVAAVRAHGRDLAIANVGQTYYALDAHCPNDGTDLAREGRLVDDRLICPHDRATYDVRTGDRIDRRGEGLERYDVRIAANEIRVGPPVADGASR